MPQTSSGILAYRFKEGELQVFLVHPGGPFWAKKDAGAWTIPKGEPGADEELLETARRELKEETGFSVDGPFLPLGSVRQSGGKVVHAFAAAADFNPEKLVSNTFEMEWPPRSGRRTTFPEIDRANWFPLEAARDKINQAQHTFLVRLSEHVPPGNPK